MPTKQKPEAPATEQQAAYTIKKRHGYRDWMVIDPLGELVCLTVYRCGAAEVVRRLTA
jgi:hypothetical protein